MKLFLFFISHSNKYCFFHRCMYPVFVCFDNLNLHFYDSFFQMINDAMITTTQRPQCLSPGPDTCFSGTNTRPWFGFDSSLFLSVRNTSTFYVNMSGLDAPSPVSRVLNGIFENKKLTILMWEISSNHLP